MTALEQYQRLESGGLWRADAHAQRRDVGVSFGNATLVITDNAGRPLTHWSLPAVTRQNPDEIPAIYAPDIEASETLEIADELMINAIEQVRTSIDETRPNPGWLRQRTGLIITAIIIALAVFWLPGALKRQTLAVVPQSKRVEIGATLLGHIQRALGPRCQNEMGLQATNALKERLLGADSPHQIVIIPNLKQGAIMLPGDIILLDANLLDATDDPAGPAGFILAALAGAMSEDPLKTLLDLGGVNTTFKLLTTSDIPTETLQADADAIVAGARPNIDSDTLTNSFQIAKLDSTSFNNLYNTRLPTSLIIAKPDETTETLDDSTWVALQNICN